MAWIESHQSLLKHPKTTTAVGVLGCDRHKLIGHLMSLWWWGIDIADAEGRLPTSCTEHSIADAAGWPLEDAKTFVDALVTCGGRRQGFLERKNGRYILHDWNEYTSRLYSLRAVRSEAGRLGGIKSGEARREAKRSKREAKPRSNEAPTNLTNQPNQTNQPDQPTRAHSDDPVSQLGIDFATFGSVSAGTPQAIEYAVEDYSLEWVQKAVRKASGSNFDDRPPWAYVESMLERWKAQGGPDESKPVSNGTATARRPAAATGYNAPDAERELYTKLTREPPISLD
jgi:hypothetical protein